MRNECRDVPKNRELENYCRIVANERTVIPENISYVLEYVTTHFMVASLVWQMGVE